jgi:wobble nucleotide-excising tRNase
MIKRINKLKKFGIFENYAHNASLADFNRYNLFYGWNGSGKSTLSNLFRWIETKQPICFADAEWEIDTESGSVNQANVTANTLNIKVFNKDFVRKNVFTDNGVKGIVYLSEKAGKDKSALDSEVNQLKENEKQQKKIDIELNGDKDNKKVKGLLELNDNFLKTSAQKIKGEFTVIEVSDKWLLNYDKRKLADFISENKPAIQSGKSKLSVAEIDRLSKSIKPQEKNFINPDEIKKFDTSLFATIFKRVNILLSTSITAKTIERLKENSIIANWVYQGLKEVHVDDAVTCEFCGQTLPKDRISDLNKHFSDEFEQLKTALANGLVWFDENTLEFNFPHKSSLYEEFQQQFETAVADFSDLTRELKDVLASWRKAIEQKQNNPFEIPKTSIKEVSSILNEKFGTGLKSIMSIIDQHNKKFEGLDKKVAEDKKTLELNYVSEEVRTYDFLTKKLKEEALQEELETLNKTIEQRKGKIAELKKDLSDELLGEEEFNRMLHKFLGRNDLSLETRQDGGYFIMRNKTHKADDNLSEGEQTAIGLVYFIAKLKEDGNKIEDTIVVIDDPISSFDSNHLFSAKSFIKANCEQAKQLIILTHNFWFFKLVRDWLDTKKKNKTDVQGKKIKDVSGNEIKEPLFQFYQINSLNADGNRISAITNAKKELVKYDSEYHYLFSKLKKFEKLDVFSIDDCYSCANVIRRVCEAALTFKYPQVRQIRGLLDNTSFDKEKADRIYDFLNKYSHLDRIESLENLLENKIEEGKIVVTDFLDLMNSELPEHYSNMCKTVEL